MFNLQHYTIKLASNITGAPFSFGLFNITSKKDPVFLLATNESEMVEWVSACVVSIVYIHNPLSAILLIDLFSSLITLFIDCLSIYLLLLLLSSSIIPIHKPYCKTSEVQWENDQVLEAFNDPVVQASDRGIIMGVNAPFERLFGYNKNEVIGQPLTILMPQPQASVHDEYIHRYHQTGVKRLIGKPR